MARELGEQLLRQAQTPARPAPHRLADHQLGITLFILGELCRGPDTVTRTGWPSIDPRSGYALAELR